MVMVRTLIGQRAGEVVRMTPIAAVAALNNRFAEPVDGTPPAILEQVTQSIDPEPKEVAVASASVPEKVAKRSTRRTRKR